MGRDRLAKSAIARRTEPSPRSPWSWARARLGPYASGSPCFSAPRTLVANSALPDKAHKMMRAMYPAGRSSLGRPTLDEVQKISIIYEQTSWILLDCLGDATFKALLGAWHLWKRIQASMARWAACILSQYTLVVGLVASFLIKTTALKVVAKKVLVMHLQQLASAGFNKVRLNPMYGKSTNII